MTQSRFGFENKQQVRTDPRYKKSAVAWVSFTYSTQALLHGPPLPMSGLDNMHFTDKFAETQVVFPSHL